MRKVLILTGTILLLSATGWCGGNTVYSFLRNDVGARAGAMAGSFVSVTNDPTTLFYNPASLVTIESPRGSVGFFKQLLDINSGYVAYAQTIEDIGAIGAGILYSNYGSFKETDDIGNIVGTFHASDLAFQAGYAGTLDENLYYGAALKFVYSQIADARSMGLAGDVGILYTIPESRFAFGASIRNIGRQLKTYAGNHETLPLDVTIGLSVIPRGLPLLLNVNFHKLNDDVNAFSDRFRAFTVGGEFTLSKVLQLRFGYNNEERKDLKIETSSGLAGFSIGLGISVKDYRLDYGLSSLGKIGSLHRVSIAAIL